MIRKTVWLDGRTYNIEGEEVDRPTYECPHCGNNTFGPRMSKLVKINDKEVIDAGISNDLLREIKNEVNLILAGRDANIVCGSCTNRELEDAFGL